jgi:hypothetical protein
MLNSINKNRREFIKTCLRFGVGGGLLFGGIALGLKSKTDENGLCQFTSPCQGCGQYNGCNLPKKVESKNSESKKGGNRVQK